MRDEGTLACPVSSDSRKECSADLWADLFQKKPKDVKFIFEDLIRFLHKIDTSRWHLLEAFEVTFLLVRDETVSFPEFHRIPDS